MRTFAVAWVHPDRKLTTNVDEDGSTNPTWNDKFVFRVNNEFLNSETSAIMIEIYAATWVRDIRVGIVRVLINNLIPVSSRTTQFRKQSMRFVALQVRRPSGRPQGILNVGVSLLDSTVRSMPLSSELSSSVVDYSDLTADLKVRKQNNKEEQTDPKIHLRRTQSELSDPMKDKFLPNSNPVCNNGSVINGSEISGPTKVIMGNGSLVSDVGPSASVVAAAIAKGVHANGSEVGSSIVEDWTLEQASVEGLKTKIERWKTELPPVYDNVSEQQKFRSSRGHSRRHTDGGGRLFSCFGNAYGCEFTIVCGANHNARKKKYAGGKVHVSPSDMVSGSV